MKLPKQLWLLVAVFSLVSHAHEGHDMPGALPPAPHGGVVKEAGHTGVVQHHGKEETELFFEVVYKGNELSVYPLALPVGKTNIFVPVSPKNALTKIELKVEFPRTKKRETLSAKVDTDAIRASFDSKGANRFILHVAAEYEKEQKLAKVQIERK